MAPIAAVQQGAWSGRRGQRQLRFFSLLVVLFAVSVASLAWAWTGNASAPAPAGSAQAQQQLADCGTDAACPVDMSEPQAETEPAVEAGTGRAILIFFWGVGCPHCEEAKPFVERLDRERPRLSVESIEVRKDPAGRKRFIETMKRLRVQAGGVPTFVVGDRYVVGYMKGVTEKQVTEMVDQALGDGQNAGSEQASARDVSLPLLGAVNPSAMSLPTFTVTVGLLDGINPCAMWVLLVLLGILAHVRSCPPSPSTRI